MRRLCCQVKVQQLKLKHRNSWASHYCLLWIRKPRNIFKLVFTNISTVGVAAAIKALALPDACFDRWSEWVEHSVRRPQTTPIPAYFDLPTLPPIRFSITMEAHLDKQISRKAPAGLLLISPGSIEKKQHHRVRSWAIFACHIRTTAIEKNLQPGYKSRDETSIYWFFSSPYPDAFVSLLSPLFVQAHSLDKEACPSLHELR